MNWRKSSHSAFNGSCVEVAGRWRKSSHSIGTECAEVATVTAGTVAVRDTQDREGPVLTFTPAAWREFTARVRQ